MLGRTILIGNIASIDLLFGSDLLVSLKINFTSKRTKNTMTSETNSGTYVIIYFEFKLSIIISTN